MTPTPNNEALAALKDLANEALSDAESLGHPLCGGLQRGAARESRAQLFAAIEALASSGQAASAMGWPCEIAEADFEANTITVHMLTSNYVVRAGKHYLSASPTQPASAPAREGCLYDAITWALGANGDFRPQGTMDGKYWWRGELAERAGLAWDGTRYAPTPAAPAQPRDQELPGMWEQADFTGGKTDGSTPPAPRAPSIEPNQCDGFMSGAHLDGNLHRDKNGAAFMVCQADRYAAPAGAGVEPVARETAEPAALGLKEIIDWVTDWMRDRYQDYNTIDALCTALRRGALSSLPADVSQAVPTTPPAPRAPSIETDALRAIMRLADKAKEPCGMDPESPAAIRNGKFATIAHVAAQGLGMVMGPSLAAPAGAGVEEFPLPEPDVTSHQSDSTMRSFTLHTYSARAVRDILRSYSASLGLQARTEGSGT